MMNQKHFQHVLPVARTFWMLLGLIVLLGFLPSGASAGDTPDNTQTKRVVLFQYADSPLHELGALGIIEGLEAKGFVVGENLQLTGRNAMRNTETAGDIADEIVDGNFDLILTSGTQALQAMAKANQAGNTVQVFGLVANPFNAGVGLDANDLMNHPDNLVGVGAFPPVAPVFRLARELHPGLKVVGVVWNPAEINSREGMERAREVSSELGIELLETTAGTFDEVGDAAETLVAGGAEILWIGPDNTVHHAAGEVIAAAGEGGIPVMSSMPGDAKRGALIDLSHDWNEVGKAAGAMAGDILAGADPGTIAIVIYPDRLRLVLNENALVRLNPPWSFPQDVVKRADKVIEPVN